MPPSSADLSQHIAEQLQRDFPRPARYWVAFSGGLDSSVLLDLLAGLRDSLPAPLAAVHVDHDLQPGSAAWARHCSVVCESLGVPLSLLRVDARPARGESPEAAARAARYAAIDSLLRREEMLLTAHHRDDQAETLLLQLMRGAGVAGLAAMPCLRRWKDKWQARPLLDVPQQQILDWATAHGLDWVEDPSNAETGADRNFLRHAVLPLLRSRWPAATENLARSADHCADALELVGCQARADLAGLSPEAPDRLPLQPLREMSAARRRAVFRHWLESLHTGAMPGRRRAEALDQLLWARQGAAVEISWSGWALRRFRDSAWLLPLPLPELPATVQPIAWPADGNDCLPLPGGLGEVQRVMADGGVDPVLWEQGAASVVHRSPGLRCRPAGREGTRSFKSIAREAGVPPWQRAILPVLQIDGRPAAIANCCVCEPFAVGAGRKGWHLRWRPA